MTTIIVHQGSITCLTNNQKHVMVKITIIETQSSQECSENDTHIN